GGGGDRSGDIAGEDGAAWACAAELCDVEAALGGEAARFRRRGGEVRALAVDGARLLAGREVGEDVGFLDPWAGRLHVREIDALLVGYLFGEGRGPDRDPRCRWSG